MIWRQVNQNVYRLCSNLRIHLTQHHIQNFFQELFSNRLGTGQEITCIDVETSPTSMRVVVGTKDRVVLVWQIDDQNNAKNIFSVQLSTTFPSSVAFLGNNAKDVIVFGMYDGEMYVYRP